MPNSCKDIREYYPTSTSLNGQQPGRPTVASADQDPDLMLDITLPQLKGDALAQCLQESDCIMVQRHTPRECLSEPLVDTLPMRCQQLRKGYGECKRGLIDMRKRFRGNQPLAGASEMEGGKRNKPEQLYAGKPAFESVKEISGDEVQMDPEKTRGL
ncbi:short chain dehydrogenase [Aspergillus flavus]|nr:cytochrome c oxidase assembly protein [Aspergillus flavus]RAQ45090.1 short chain dehydrogenase [Aspergillus flavus]